jgi:hypothetical protein
MKDLSILSKEAIKGMFDAIFRDLNSGKNTKEAGWRFLEELNIDSDAKEKFLIAKLIQKNSEGKIRLNFENYKTHQQLKKEFASEIEQLECFLEDRKKLEDAYAIIYRITNLLSSPENRKFIIVIGWRKMLELSEMPAKIVDILNEGFSPEDWMIKAPRCVSELALNIGGKYGEIDGFEEAIDFLEKQGVYTSQSFVPPSSVSQDEVQKVMRVLRWEEIKEELTDFNIKMLGFLWTLYFVLQNENLLPSSTEFSLKLNQIMWNNAENLFKKKQQDLLNNLENTLKKLNERGIIWASDIVRLPEII